MGASLNKHPQEQQLGAPRERGPTQRSCSPQVEQTQNQKNEFTNLHHDSVPGPPWVRAVAIHLSKPRTERVQIYKMKRRNANAWKWGNKRTMNLSPVTCLDLNFLSDLSGKSLCICFFREAHCNYPCTRRTFLGQKRTSKVRAHLIRG